MRGGRQKGAPSSRPPASSLLSPFEGGLAAGQAKQALAACLTASHPAFPAPPPLSVFLHGTLSHFLFSCCLSPPLGFAGRCALETHSTRAHAPQGRAPQPYAAPQPTHRFPLVLSSPQREPALAVGTSLPLSLPLPRRTATPPPSIRPLRIAHTAQRFWCAADPVSAPPALLLLLPLLRLYYTQHRHNYSYTPAFLTTAPCPPLFPTHRPTRPRRPSGAPRSSSASPPRSRRAAADGRSALVCTSRPTANAARPPARRAAGPLRRLPAGPRPCVIIPLPSLPLPFWNKKALAQVEPPAFRPFYETAGFALTLIAPRRRRNASPDTRTCETTPQPLRRSSPDGPRPPLSTAIRFSSLRPPPL